MSDTQKEANDYLSCAKLQNSQVKERNPDTVCTTKTGKSFIETPAFFKQETPTSTSSSEIQPQR